MLPCIKIYTALTIFLMWTIYIFNADSHFPTTQKYILYFQQLTLSSQKTYILNTDT